MEWICFDRGDQHREAGDILPGRFDWYDRDKL